jgi:hypothetical protein
VLSTRYATTSNGAISGLLYVPDLPDGDPCVAEVASHVPLSVVRQSDLPPTNFHLIAIAPWVSGDCSSAYLDAASTAPVRAFLFYMPGNASAPAPSADADDWYIDDDDDWTTQTDFPVFGISGMAGELMMQHLSLYSGNMTEVPFGRNITDRFLADTEDYLRIWTELDVSTTPMAFGTWVYFLIILGVLLTVIASTSLLMHFVQSRRRSRLRRRVISGEVNLEAMGIKHLTVPMRHIQTFPLFTYHYEPDLNSPPLSPRSARTARTKTRTRSLDQSESAKAAPVARSATASDLGPASPVAASTAATDYQPTCEICLEPFENRITVIRELPCGHIFHPECIDEFLHEISSLCPICKASMLPEGHCPKVTNSMVRRERAVRRLRGRIDEQDDDEGFDSAKPQTWWGAAKGRLRRVRGDGPMSSTSTELQETRPISKKHTPRRVRLEPPPTAEEELDPQGAPTALARERMRELAGFEPDYGEGGVPRCKSIHTPPFISGTRFMSLINPPRETNTHQNIPRFLVNQLPLVV